MPTLSLISFVSYSYVALVSVLFDLVYLTRNQFMLRDCNLQQITRIGNSEYTGETKRGDIWLKPSSHNAFWSSEEPNV